MEFEEGSISVLNDAVADAQLLGKEESEVEDDAVNDKGADPGGGSNGGGGGDEEDADSSTDDADPSASNDDGGGGGGGCCAGGGLKELAAVTDDTDVVAKQEHDAFLFSRLTILFFISTIMNIIWFKETLPSSLLGIFERSVDTNVGSSMPSLSHLFIAEIRSSRFIFCGFSPAFPRRSIKRKTPTFLSPIFAVTHSKKSFFAANIASAE